MASQLQESSLRGSRGGSGLKDLLAAAFSLRTSLTRGCMLSFLPGSLPTPRSPRLGGFGHLLSACNFEQNASEARCPCRRASGQCVSSRIQIPSPRCFWGSRRPCDSTKEVEWLFFLSVYLSSGFLRLLLGQLLSSLTSLTPTKPLLSLPLVYIISSQLL